MSKLTPKQARFVAEFLIDLNGTQAAIRAGYSPKTARAQGSRLLTNAAIASVVAEGKARQLREADITATRTLQEAARLAYSDVTVLLDAKGNILPMREWPVDTAAAVGGFEVVRRNSGGGHQDEVIRARLWDKPRMLELLFRHLGLLKETPLRGTLEIHWQDRIKAGRNRLAAAKAGAQQ